MTVPGKKTLSDAMMPQLPISGNPDDVQEEMAANLTEFFNKKDDLAQVPTEDAKRAIARSATTEIASDVGDTIEAANDRWRANRKAMFQTKATKTKGTEENVDSDAEKGSTFDGPYAIVAPLNHLFYPSSMEEVPMAIYEVLGLPEDAELRANVIRSTLFGALHNMGCETRVVGSEYR